MFHALTGLPFSSSPALLDPLQRIQSVSIRLGGSEKYKCINILMVMWSCCFHEQTLNKLLMPALKVQPTEFPRRTVHLGMQGNTDGQKQTESWIMK